MVAVLILGFAVSQPVPPGIWHDDGVYLLIAKSLAQGDGLRYSGLFDELAAPKFPPVYPAVLAAIWRLGPDFPDSGTWMAAANTVFVALAAGALLLLLRGRIAWAVGVSAVVFLSPEIWRLAAVPLSEPLFMAAFFGALWAGTRFESSGSSRDAALFLALFWLSFHIRTVGIVLLPAVAWAAWRRRWTGEAVTVGVVGALGVLPWMVFSRTATERIPEPARDILGAYGPWLVDQIRDHPRKYLGYLAGNAQRMIDDAATLLLPGAPGWTGWILALGVAVGGWMLGRHSRTTVMAVALYLATVWLWPFQSRRLLVPVLPLLAGLLAATVPARMRWGRIALGAWAAWFAVSGLRTLTSGSHLEAYRLRSEVLVEAATAVARNTPPDAVVGAPEIFAALHLYTDRTVAPSARFLPLAEEGPSWGTEEQQYELWQATGMDHLLVEHAGGVHGAALDRMDERCPNGGVVLLASLSGSFLVQLEAGADCYARLRP